MTSALFNSMFNLGNLLAPVIAAVMYDWKGYQATTDLMMVGSAGFMVVFACVMFRE